MFMLVLALFLYLWLCDCVVVWLFVFVFAFGLCLVCVSAGMLVLVCLQLCLFDLIEISRKTPRSVRSGRHMGTKHRVYKCPISRKVFGG